MTEKNKKKTKAAISIFLIMVLVSEMLLAGLFIDGARILLAKRMVANAAESAARSALSYYDAHLSGEYGLFAVDKTKSEEAFRHYFKTNIELSGGDGANFVHLNVKDESIKVSASQPILDKTNMQSGIEEYSKYRTIVDIFELIISKVTSITKASKKVFNATDSAKDGLTQLNDDIKELSNASRGIIGSLATTSKERAENLIKKIDSGEKVKEEDYGFDEMKKSLDEADRKADEMDGAVEEYNEKMNKSADEIKNEMISETSYYDEESGKIITVTPDPPEYDDSNIKNGADEAISDAVTKEKNDVKAEANKARQRVNDNEAKIKNQVEVATKAKNEMDKVSSDYDKQKAQTSLLQTKLSDLTDKKQKDPYNFVYTDIYKEDIDLLNSQIDELKFSLDLMKASEKSSEDIEKTEQSIKELEYRLAFVTKRADWETAKNDKEIKSKEKEKIKNEYVSAAKNYIEYCKKSGIELKTIYDDDIKAIEEAYNSSKLVEDELKKQSEKKKAEYDKEKKELTKLYGQISGDSTTASSLNLQPKLDEETFEEATNTDALSFVAELIKGFRENVVELGKIASDPTSGVEELDEKALNECFGWKALLGNVFGIIDDLSTLINSVAALVENPESLSEAADFVDYLYNTHAFLTSHTARGSHHFKLGELEYVYSGNDSQAGSIIDSLFAIARFRFAINFADYLITSKIPTVWSRIVTALGRAALRTLTDLASMVFSTAKGESAACELSPSLRKIKFTYSEHLIFLMAIKAVGDRETMMNRLQQLMKDTYQVNEWGTMDGLQTHIDAEVTVEVDLIMMTLPMFEKLLPKDNQILQDGKFLVHEKVSMGY